MERKLKKASDKKLQEYMVERSTQWIWQWRWWW